MAKIAAVDGGGGLQIVHGGSYHARGPTNPS